MEEIVLRLTTFKLLIQFNISGKVTIREDNGALKSEKPKLKHDQNK